MKQITCEQIENLYSQILDNEPIDSLERKLFDEHLAQCEKCRSRFLQWQKMEDSVMTMMREKKQRHITTEKLALFIEDKCESEFEKMLIEDHLKDCVECRDAYEDILLLNQLENQFVIRLPLFRRIREKIRRVMSKLALSDFTFNQKLVRQVAYSLAAAVVLIFIVLSITVLKRGANTWQQPELSVADQQDTLKQEEAKAPQQVQTPEKKESLPTGKKKPSIGEKLKQLYAENFKPLPAMEGMLAYNARSASVKIISPQNGQNFQKEVFFQWENQENKPFYLKIYSNRGVELFSSRVDTTQFVLTKKIDPGLYYWKLESDDELLYLGKFFVRRE